MTSPSNLMTEDAWIGCSIPAEKGRHFVQLVGSGALFERKVLASAFGVDYEDAMLKAMKIAGVTEVKGPAQYKPTFFQRLSAALGPPRGFGVLSAIGVCEREMGGLTDAIRKARGAGESPGFDDFPDARSDDDVARKRVQGELFGDD